MANLSHLNVTVLLAFVVIPSRICMHIASVLKPAMGVACPLMCMYKSHTKKCGGNVPMIIFPSRHMVDSTETLLRFECSEPATIYSCQSRPRAVQRAPQTRVSFQAQLREPRNAPFRAFVFSLPVIARARASEAHGLHCPSPFDRHL